MRVIEQSAEIQDWTDLNLYERVEIAARVCRRSECKGDAEGFVRSLVQNGHFPPLEFARIKIGLLAGENVRRIRERAENGEADWYPLMSRLTAHWPALVEDLEYAVFNTEPIIIANDWIPVLITTSRTISHQLVRYRNDITYCQESQRHVRYDKTGIEVIEPPGLNQLAWNAWNFASQDAEGAYVEMMEAGASAEQARSVLPGCTATRILAYASPGEWRHIFSQRCDRHADPQMRALMEPLQARMQELRLI